MGQKKSGDRHDPHFFAIFFRIMIKHQICVPPVRIQLTG